MPVVLTQSACIEVCGLFALCDLFIVMYLPSWEYCASLAALSSLKMLANMPKEHACRLLVLFRFLDLCSSWDRSQENMYDLCFDAISSCFKMLFSQRHPIVSLYWRQALASQKFVHVLLLRIKNSLHKQQISEEWAATVATHRIADVSNMFPLLPVTTLMTTGRCQQKFCSGFYQEWRL